MTELTLPTGLYEKLVTIELAEELSRLHSDLVPSFRPPDPGDSIDYFGEYMGAYFREILRLIKEEGDAKLAAQVEACNSAIQICGDLRGSAGHLLHKPAQLLTEIRTRAAGSRELPRPVIPLNSSALLVNDDERLSAAAVVKREIVSADAVDLICAFVNYTGVRILEDEIRCLCRRGKMRLITTTYMGATQRRALDTLSAWGVEIRIAFELPPSNTKLHAKAWLFRRLSGYDTTLIGSSNISHSALMDGLEWNVRLARAETPQVIDRFQSTFERYWNDPSFEGYDPNTDAQKLDRALSVSGGRDQGIGPEFFLDVTPRPHQVDILEALAADRDRGHFKNLIVAATGTGKTVVAALDYKRMRKPGTLPSLLFVAHRLEILRQSQTVFRNVLRDGSFGELWVGGARPSTGQHVFAAVQSLHETALDTLNPEQFDVLIVDEFHHAEAPTYRRLLNHFRPGVLVGLTATPERTDGSNVTRFFGDRATYEMRLWDALEDQLLCPFQYFGIADTVDLSRVPWRAGRYAEKELENAYLEHGQNGVAMVLASVERIVTDWRQMRALGFCVGIKHAQYMAEKFCEFGIPSQAVTSLSSAEERQDAVRNLRQGTLNALFTVDLFNEGVDIPEADTLLFLRPTESATVFIQQLGRGLRLCDGKPCTTVLDFVGQQNTNFRFDQRFRAVTGISRSELEHQLENGFTSLPAGCHIQLDRVTQRQVLANLRAAIPSRTPQLISEYRSLSGGRTDYPLKEFLRETRLELSDLYRVDRCYTSIKRGAGCIRESATESERKMTPGLSRLLHSVDEERLRSLVELLDSDSMPDISKLTARQRNELYMLIYGISSQITLNELQDAAGRLWGETSLRRELTELIAILAGAAPPGPVPLGVPALESVPLFTYGTYSQDEVMTAFGMNNPSAMRQGVRYFDDVRCDVLFVTLRKTDGEYSATTRYNDFPMTQTLFHWESQNAAGPESATGKRYINHVSMGSSVLLFVRDEKSTDGKTNPYFCCGPVEYQSHESSKPMKIIWKLRKPLPHSRFMQFRTVAG